MHRPLVSFQHICCGPKPNLDGWMLKYLFSQEITETPGPEEQREP